MRTQTVMTLAMVLASAGSAWGQRGRGPGAGLMRNFERAAPGVGDLLPDVSAYDAEGRPFRLRSMRGHYSVLVFGCLT